MRFFAEFILSRGAFFDRLRMSGGEGLRFFDRLKMTGRRMRSPRGYAPRDDREN